MSTPLRCSCFTASCARVFDSKMLTTCDPTFQRSLRLQVLACAAKAAGAGSITRRRSKLTAVGDGEYGPGAPAGGVVQLQAPAQVGKAFTYREQAHPWAVGLRGRVGDEAYPLAVHSYPKMPLITYDGDQGRRCFRVLDVVEKQFLNATEQDGADFLGIRLDMAIGGNADLQAVGIPSFTGQPGQGRDETAFIEDLRA